MAKKLYVGGLPWAVRNDELREMFEKAGEVIDSFVVLDSERHRSRGFGFVEMENDDEAMAAIDMWNDQEYQGRTLIVNEAQPKN